MIVQIQDLNFRVHSPSCYELVSVRDDVESDAKVFVQFTGHRWVIRYRSPTTDILRLFASKEAAIALIKERAP